MDQLNEMYMHLLSAMNELHQLEENEHNSKSVAEKDIQECIYILQCLASEEE